jgi:O-antigen/teichoic acid export membrane protein
MLLQLQEKLNSDTRRVFLIQMVKILLGFALSLALARTLGAAELGRYAYVVSWASLASVFTNRGFSELIIRELAKYQVAGKWALMRGLLRQANLTSLKLSMIPFALFAIALATGIPIPAAQESGNLLAGCVLVLLLCLNAHRQAALRALGKANLALIPEYILKPLLMICSLSLLFGVKAEINALSALVINLGATLLVLMAGAHLLDKELPLEVKATEPDFERSEWWYSCKHFLLIGGMLIINSQIDKIMLGSMGYMEQVGVYAIAAQIASLAGMTLIALNVAVTPSIIRLVHESQLDTLQRLVARSAGWALLGTTLLALAILALGAPLLEIFGKDFSTGRLALAILLIGQLVNVAAGPSGTLLKMLGHERALSAIVGLSAALNIVCNAIVIPHYGMDGAAVATVLSLTVWNALAVWLLYRREKIISTPIVPVRG